MPAVHHFTSQRSLSHRDNTSPHAIECISRNELIVSLVFSFLPQFHIHTRADVPCTEEKRNRVQVELVCRVWSAVNERYSQFVDWMNGFDRSAAQKRKRKPNGKASAVSSLSDSFSERRYKRRKQCLLFEIPRFVFDMPLDRLRFQSEVMAKSGKVAQSGTQPGMITLPFVLPPVDITMYKLVLDYAHERKCKFESQSDQNDTEETFAREELPEEWDAGMDVEWTTRERKLMETCPPTLVHVYQHAVRHERNPMTQEEEDQGDHSGSEGDDDHEYDVHSNKDDSADNNDWKRWLVIINQGGYFASAVFLSKPPTYTHSRELKLHCLEHTTFHKYVVRAKQGKRQVSKDRSKSIRTSAGSQLRRHNEDHFRLNVESFLEKWEGQIDSADIILLHSPGPWNKSLLFEGRQGSLQRDDPRIYSVPLSIPQPKHSETGRVFKTISTVTFSYR